MRECAVTAVARAWAVTAFRTEKGERARHTLRRFISSLRRQKRARVLPEKDIETQRAACDVVGDSALALTPETPGRASARLLMCYATSVMASVL